MKSTLPILGALILLFAFSSCSVEEIDVSYLVVPEIEIQPSATSGEISQRIEHVRVVAEATSLGFYPMPNRIPIVGSGSRKIRLEPVINRAGLTSELLVYPLYEAFDQQLQLAPGRIDTIRPQLNYRPEVIFGLVEDFTGSSTPLREDLDGDPLTTFSTIVDLLEPSRRVGRVVLTAENPIFEIATEAIFPAVPISDIWLEMDYRGESVISVAALPLVALTENERGQFYNQGALPRETWQKFYFNLANELTRNILASSFRVGFLAGFDPAGPAEQEIFLDNIKVVYR